MPSIGPKSLSDEREEPSQDLSTNWEEISLFHNRPYTTLEFERQLDKLFQWLIPWSYEKKCVFTERLLKFCNYGLIRFLWTVLEPMLHRDFIYTKLDVFPKSDFYTLSSYVSRELYSRLEKTVNKYRRKRREVHRIPSSMVKNEDDVREWNSGSVLPVIRGFEGGRGDIESRPNPNMSKACSTLPYITSRMKRSTLRHRTATAPTQDMLKRIPLRHQTKKRHLQRDEVRLIPAQESKEFICRNSHERSHMNLLRRARSCSSLNHYEVEASTAFHTEARNHTALDLPSERTSPSGKNFAEEEGRIVNWFRNRWNDWQRKEFLQLYLQTLNTSQTYLLYGFIMVRLYRDFISLLPRHLSIKILSYLSSQDLIVATKVCLAWKERASDDKLWKGKCKERHVSASYLNLNWKDTYLKYDNLEENWRKAKYNVHEFLGHTASVTAVRTFKNVLASGSSDKTIKIWNADTGELIQTLRGHTKGVWGLRFMSKMLLVSCSNDQTIRIWNLRKGTCARTFHAHDGGIWCIEQKGELLVSGSADKTAKIWNLRHCRLKSTLVGHASSIFGVDFDQDRGLVFTGSGDKTVRMWSMATSECLKCILVATDNFPITAISYDEGFIACSFFNMISIWNIETWKCHGTLRGHRERVETLQLSSRNTKARSKFKVLVSCSRDGKVKYWDIDNCTCMQSFRGHEDSITCVIFDDTRIVTASQDSTVKLWDFLQ
eukprot:gene12720-14025_t